jgi:hypothetical protein
MSAPSSQVAVPAPGNQGLNTEMSPFQADQQFALRADNAVIDRVGRLSCREAFADHIPRSSIPGDYDLVRMASIEGGDFSNDAVFAIAGQGRKMVNRNNVPSGMVEDSVYNLEIVDFNEYIGVYIDNGVVAQLPSVRPSNGVSNCQLVPFKDAIYIFSKGDAPMVFKDGAATKLSDAPNYLPPQTGGGVIAQELDGDIACAAYGRLWVSGVNDDYNTIYYSDLLIPEQWYDGTAEAEDSQNTAGIIKVDEYWPTGSDKIQGIAAHNGFLVIFGRHSILIYSGAQGDPAAQDGLKLEDAIRDVGLVNQDAMCNIGTEHMFVDNLGVRALGRVIQEKSTPLAEPSLNVATEIREMIDTQSDTVRMMHLPRKSLAVCLFPEISEAFVFQLGQPSSTGGYKLTRWTGCDFYDSITARTDDDTLTLMAGRNSRGITKYEGYKQPKDYEFVYESPVINVTGNIMQTVIPKNMSYSFVSNRNYSMNATWGFGADLNKSQRIRPRNQAGDSEFQTSSVSMNGSGTMLRVGLKAGISGDLLSVQQITINTQAGRVIV